MAEALPPGVPGYWTKETSGLLRPAVEAYLAGGSMTEPQIGFMRDYLRQWIEAPAFRGFVVDELRRALDGLTTRQAIKDWLDLADEAGIDPL